MSLYKPMKRRDYEKWIRQYGWQLQKAGSDWKLVDENGHVIVKNIIVTHPGNDVIADSVNKTQRMIDKLGG